MTKRQRKAALKKKYLIPRKGNEHLYEVIYSNTAKNIYDNTKCHETELATDYKAEHLDYVDELNEDTPQGIPEKFVRAKNLRFNEWSTGLKILLLVKWQGWAWKW